MTVEIYALGCVLASALLKIVHSSSMQSLANRSAVLLWYNIAGGLLLLPFTSVESIAAVPAFAWMLLTIASIFWLICDSLHLESMKYLSAADNEIVSTLRVVLIALIGVIFFQDHLSISASMGMILIIASMLYNVDLSSLELNRGTRLALFGAAFATAAVAIDKILLGFVQPQIVVVCAFLFPGMILLLRNHRQAQAVPQVLKLVGIPLIVAPLIGVFRYYCMVHAYSLGQLSSVTMILQATVFAVFVIEFLILRRNRGVAFQKGISSVGCAAGAILVCL